MSNIETQELSDAALAGVSAGVSVPVAVPVDGTVQSALGLVSEVASGNCLQAGGNSIGNVGIGGISIG